MGVLGFVAPLPDKHAVPSGEHDRRFDFRQDRLRNKSLLTSAHQQKKAYKQTEKSIFFFLLDNLARKWD